MGSHFRGGLHCKNRKSKRIWRKKMANAKKMAMAVNSRRKLDFHLPEFWFVSDTPLVLTKQNFGFFISQSCVLCTYATNGWEAILFKNRVIIFWSPCVCIYIYTYMYLCTWWSDKSTGVSSILLHSCPHAPSLPRRIRTMCWYRYCIPFIRVIVIDPMCFS